MNGLPAGDLAELVAARDDIGGPATYPVYPMGWGQVSNTPLKRYKQNTHSGGIRDPFILAWPGRTRDAGSIRSQFLHASDIVPTVLDLVGVDPPADIGGVAQMPIEGSSFAATLKDPAAPSKKAQQYFEMLGNRAIWSAGWKAVTYHAPGTAFDDDRWELYHLETDFSECHDLAEAEPDKLAELVAMWWSEADTYQVLPLDDRILERFLVPKPRPITDRSVFVYYPGIRIPGEGAAAVIDVSYSITAYVDRGDSDAAGVLICHGDRFSGYSLFVYEDRLVHDYNCAGTHYIVRSSLPVPVGPSVLEYVFTKTGPLRGVGSLRIDGNDVGRVEMPQTLGTHLNAVGVSIGRNPLSAVSDLYRSPFEFSGRLVKVVVEIGTDRGILGMTEILGCAAIPWSRSEHDGASDVTPGVGDDTRISRPVARRLDGQRRPAGCGGCR